MISLPIISIICCFAYMIYIVLKYGVPVSISETYYLLPNKWDWLFAAWTVMTSVPFGIYWWSVAPDNLKWIPITVAIALLLVGAACCYKSGPKNNENYEPRIINGKILIRVDLIDEPKSWWQKIIDYLKTKFNPKNFFKYGPARLIHYVNSLIAIILSTVYICITAGTPAIVSTILSYVIFTIIGVKIEGVYNADYAVDLNNKSEIFFWEIVCFLNLFIFIWF